MMLSVQCIDWLDPLIAYHLVLVDVSRGRLSDRSQGDSDVLHCARVRICKKIMMRMTA